jgi:hypothetical protein
MPVRREGQQACAEDEDEQDCERDVPFHERLAQQLGLPLQSAVAKPSEFSTRWPGMVKARNAAATTTTANTAIIFFMAVSCARSATAGAAAIRRGEAERVEHAMARSRKAQKTGHDSDHGH